MSDNQSGANKSEAIAESPFGGPGGKIASAIGTIIAAIYLLNPTAGIFEWIPDNLPIVGNLDEAAATALLIYGLRVIFRKKE